MKKQSFFLQTLGLVKFASPTIVLLSLNLLAQPISLVDFNKFYKSGQYSKALETLEKNNLIQFDEGEKSYWEGLCYSKLQEYDKAITQFEIALKNKNQNNDLSYEYGQALYAANELKAARKAFMDSAAQKFNISASKYYVAHISQILEEYQTAKINYEELLDNKETDNKIKQIANFQLAETNLVLAKEKAEDKIFKKDILREKVEGEILPALKLANDIDPKTTVAEEIRKRISELQIEFNLDPDLLINGRRIASKRYSGYLSTKIKFDDNISLTNEENNVQQTKSSSLISESELYAKYDLVLKKRVIISPEFRFNFIQHSDQNDSAVYQNDSYSLNANLKNKYEHFIFEKQASFLLDFEVGKTYKDWNLTHSRDAFADTQNIGIGESFSYFNSGDTSLKLKFKNYVGANLSISNRTLSISGDQTVSLSSQHLLIALLEAAYIDNYNNESSSTNTYLLRFDYLIPQIFPAYTLTLALATTITDTKAENATRGTELMLNPSVDLAKEINKKIKISLNYEYTKNKSKLSNYDYQKHVITTELKYSF